MNALDTDVVGAARADDRPDRDGGRLQGAGHPQRGATTSASAPTSGWRCSPPTSRMWAEIEQLVERGQQAYKALKYAPFPVVGAPAGMALGGGCEILLHCDAVQAHAETYMGLVEVGVGADPRLGRLQGDAAPLDGRPEACRAGRCRRWPRRSRLISTARSPSRRTRRSELMFLRPTDGITMNRDRLLADAKAKALSLVEGYTPPEPMRASPARADRAAWPWSWRSQGIPRHRQGDRRTTWWSRATRGGADRRRHRHHRRRWARTTCSRWSAALHGAAAHAGTLARIEHMLDHRQAAAQLRPDRPLAGRNPCPSTRPRCATCASSSTNSSTSTH